MKIVTIYMELSACSLGIMLDGFAPIDFDVNTGC